MPTAKTPKNPTNPCIYIASTGSSILIFVITQHANIYTNPLITPIAIAAHGSTLLQDAVIDTRPASIPLASDIGL
jgi:hypothetical protein